MATAKAAPADFTVSFTLERETKNTYRFAETSDEPVIGTLYVQKAAFSETPSSLIVTVSVS